MTSSEKIKELADQGKINEARLVYAREYLRDGSRRTWKNIVKWVTGKMTVKELNKDTKQRMREIRELAKILFSVVMAMMAV